MVKLDLDALSDTKRDEYIISPEETILVTGANGFVGTRVVRTLLSYGFKKVRCLTRSTSKSRNLEDIGKEFAGARLEIIRGNLLSRDDCLRLAGGVSIIYHLAAGVEKSFPGCFLNSVVTTRNLLEAVIKGQTLKRFVNISSIAVYSNEKIPRGGLLDESCEVDTKFVERWEAYTVIVRPSVVFGPGKAKITDRIGTNTFGIFLHLGLNNHIPLTYVDNCAEAIVLAGLRKGIEGQVFNVFDDDLPTSREFLKRYKREVHYFLSIPIPYWAWFFFCCLWEKYSQWSEGQLPPVFNRRTCAVYWKGNRYSNTKAKELLGWRPRVPMKESLQRFFAYMKDAETKKK
jgi:nucleoside-diphosphate-sugar epimerase